jgi:glycine cleavage system P protein (glycine dehydrogenase) subunit 1
MDYTQITPQQREAMLKAVGAASMEDLLKQFPAELRMKRPLDLPQAMDELTLHSHLCELAEKNAPASSKVCFLGAGAYDHFIPTAVDALASKGEFVTAYTPYQAEASQGSLQAFFEFQTMICQLAGMDIANASLYEGATALAEAVLMACNASGKRQILLSRGVSPDYRRVLQTYLSDLPLTLVEVDLAEGVTDLAKLKAALTPDTAAVVLQSPNFLGLLEDVPQASAIAHGAGTSLVQAFNPISVGILKRPGDLGADIAIAEGQPLGIPLSFGGPYLGLFAAKQQFLRRMPGRLVGQTVDADGNRAFCLTLQTREQHIRREKATSNVCTNQGLMALRTSVYMAAMGPQGLKQVAQLCHNKAAYFAALAQGKGLSLKYPGQPFFNEVLVELKSPAGQVLRQASDAGVLAGYEIGRDYAELGDCLLVAFTEKRTRAQISRLVEVLA